MKRLLGLTLAILLLIPAMGALAEYGEAPGLSDMVAAGDLPPVEERLPKEPYVSTAKEIGVYGGIFRGAGFGPTHGQLDTEGMRFIGLLRVLPDMTTVEPFLLKDYAINEDFTAYTLFFREGTKWSDGEPFTADDVLFFYDDIIQNKEVTPALPTKWRLCTGFEKVDDYTVKITFSEPNPSFLVAMQKGGPGDWIWAAKHHLQQWHIDYNPDAGKLAKEEGFESWALCFNAHKDRGQTGTDFGPDLTPFVLYEIDTLGNKYFKRNPYYFVVDAAGNQLPYIDEQQCVIVSDAQARTQKLINGELHAAGENPLPVKDYTLYKENEDKGNYIVFLFQNSRGSDCSFTFNQTIADANLREIFTSLKFREAMSVAIDRSLINETLYFGLADERQAVPPANTSYYEEWMGAYKAYYDPDEANAILDELGYAWSADGTVRLMPNGQPFNLILETIEEFVPMGEMVSEMWTAVGVKTTLKQQERSFARERFMTNEREVQCFTFDSVAEPTLIAGNFDKMRPPFASDELGFAPLWHSWYDSAGEKGEEPPASVQALREKMLAQVRMVQGSPEYLALGTEILTEFTEQLYYIGLTVAPRVIILSRDLGNTPTDGIFAGDYNFWYPFNCDAWYFKK
ncbi:MAG TPA: ABC transporter substrate-binding protein [Clostridia bacterium]|nr:ABC transporter substrate-binding protein [Clostridia bacterium]